MKLVHNAGKAAAHTTHAIASTPSAIGKGFGNIGRFFKNIGTKFAEGYRETKQLKAAEDATIATHAPDQPRQTSPVLDMARQRMRNDYEERVYKYYGRQYVTITWNEFNIPILYLSKMPLEGEVPHKEAMRFMTSHE